MWTKHSSMQARQTHALTCFLEFRGVCTEVINSCDVLDLWRERRAADMHEAARRLISATALNIQEYPRRHE